MELAKKCSCSTQIVQTHNPPASVAQTGTICSPTPPFFLTPNYPRPFASTSSDKTIWDTFINTILKENIVQKYKTHYQQIDFAPYLRHSIL